MNAVDSKTQVVVVRLVGNNFRQAGSAVLPTLGAGTILILEPEPTNPYDANAIKVCVDLQGSKTIFGTASYVERVVHLGYVPRIKTAEVMSIIQGPDWIATLAFNMQGDPLVRIESEQRNS